MSQSHKPVMVGIAWGARAVRFQVLIAVSDDARQILHEVRRSLRPVLQYEEVKHAVILPQFSEEAVAATWLRSPYEDGPNDAMHRETMLTRLRGAPLMRFFQVIAYLSDHRNEPLGEDPEYTYSRSLAQAMDEAAASDNPIVSALAMDMLDRMRPSQDVWTILIGMPDGTIDVDGPYTVTEEQIGRMCDSHVKAFPGARASYFRYAGGRAPITQG
jgi:hypothetical protein